MGDRLGVALEIYRSPVAGILTGVSLLVSFAMIVYFMHPQLIQLFFWSQKQKWIWILLAVGVYFIAISGVLYDIIRGVPFAGVNRRGGIEVFSTQSGVQYGLEGIVIGFINTIIGTSALVLVLWAPRLSGQTQMMVVTVCCAVFAMFFMMLSSFYRMKSPWYTPMRLF